MKPKTKRLGRKLLSVFIALSLSAALAGTPVLPSLTANAGATINIITGKWGAVAMEYLERSILRTIGSAAAHAENEAVADILTTTKKFLASPMSSTLGDIKKMCAQMNAKLDNITKMISNNQDILVSKLDAVTEQQLKDNYTAQKSKLDNIKNVYANVINLFYNLNDKAQKVDLNDQDSIKALSTAYDSLNEIYEVANGITTRTGMEFNFSTDANTIAGIISAYPYSAAVDYSVDPGDNSAWNADEKSDVPTMIDYYYQSLKYSDAFDHEYYRDMSAQYTYAAGVVSNYLEAYNLYVSYAAQLIYAGQVDGITNDRDKQKEVDKLWDGYNQKCYILLRALSQMMDGYDSKLSGVMREYDINTVIHFDNIKESINSGGVYEERMNDRKESKRNKTSKRMQANQMRPFGSTTAYALRKTNSSQPAILMDDLSYYAFDIRVMAFPFYQNDCTGPTCDYRNLVDYAATSPTCWEPLSKNTQLDGLVNTTAFEKVTGQSNPSYITNYLKAHGIVNDLPKMDSSNKWALSKKYDWNYDSDGYVGNWDIDMHFYTVNTLKKGTSMSEEVFDMEKIPDSRTGKEVSIFYTGEPQVAVYLPSNGGAQYQYSAVDYKGNAASANGGRNVYRSGGTVTLRIKPDDGKYIKSLRLCDRFVYDDDHSKGTLTQYVSEDDALYKADSGVYPDSDGYYTFKINVPFRDGSVILDLADVPSKIHTVTLAESEDVVSGDQYDKDGGILTFSNFSGESSKKVNAGDTISAAVIPYTGYLCTGLEIKDSSGNTYTAQKADSSEYYSMVHGQTNFSFTMPDTDVTVKAIYEKGNNVELIHSTKYPNASLHFINENGTADNTATVRTYIQGTAVNIEATATNGHVISAVIVKDLTNREYITCDMTDSGVSFIMPDGNVQVEAQTQKQDMNTYLVGTAEDSEVVFNFLNDDNIVRNVPSVQAKEGDIVRFTADCDVPEGRTLLVSAAAANGSAVRITESGEKTYSLTMPASNVTITGSVTVEPEPENTGINTYEELVAFAENVKNDYAHYGKAQAWLTANISAPEGSKWTEIIGASEDKPFNGTFDGRGFAIVGLDISSSKIGSLFGYIGESGTVKDLAVIETTFSVKSETAGGIAAYNSGTIDHCTSGINSDIRKLDITSRKFNSSIYGVAAGGIAAYNNGTIIGCRNSGYVNGQDLGGIAAYNNGTIYGCANNGAVGSDSSEVKRAGGITAENKGTIEACYNSGKETGSINTLKAAVSVANEGIIKNTFYNTNGDTIPAFADGMNTGEAAVTEKTIKNMLTAGFVDELNAVTDDTVMWKHIEYNKKTLNQGFPIIKGRFIENIEITVPDNVKMKVKAAIIKAMNINFFPMNLRSAGYNTMVSAAGSRTLTCAYDFTSADANGTELPAELWCEGLTISVPVSTDDAQIIILDDNGEAYAFAPESIENGMATFTVTEPAAFAVAENKSVPDPSENNVKTGESSLPLTAACAVFVLSALFGIIAWRKKNRE